MTEMNDADPGFRVVDRRPHGVRGKTSDLPEWSGR
jgi:hypothetical protein